MHRSRSSRSSKQSRWHSQPLLVLTCLVVSALFIGYNLYRHTISLSSHRTCNVPWQAAAQHGKRLRIALVSMATDAGHAAHNARASQFAEIRATTTANKLAYARKHGYTFVDASDSIDASRPASWSKIHAVQRVLPMFDWVFYMDSDALVTNASITVESIVPTDPNMQLVLTRDATGFNAGMWLIRSSRWSHDFLNLWWAMSDFIRPARDTKSGDNDALKHLLHSMPSDEFSAHVAVPRQCAFNSYVWFNSLRQWGRLLMDPSGIMQGLWRPGDFVVHLAGVKDKAAALDALLPELNSGSSNDQAATATSSKQPNQPTSSSSSSSVESTTAGSTQNGGTT